MISLCILHNPQTRCFTFTEICLGNRYYDHMMQVDSLINCKNKWKSPSYFCFCINLSTDSDTRNNRKIAAFVTLRSASELLNSIELDLTSTVSSRNVSFYDRIDLSDRSLTDKPHTNLNFWLNPLYFPLVKMSLFVLRDKQTAKVMVWFRIPLTQTFEVIDSR